MEIREYTIRCYDIEAGKDCTANRVPNALNFWSPADKGKKYKLGVFTIVSEKEK
jgi:hypothetical protein